MLLPLKVVQAKGTEKQNTSHTRQTFCRQNQKNRNQKRWKFLDKPACLGRHHPSRILCVHIAPIRSVCCPLPKEVKESSDYKCPASIVNCVFLADHCKKTPCGYSLIANMPERLLSSVMKVTYSYIMPSSSSLQISLAPSMYMNSNIHTPIYIQGQCR